MNKHTLGATDKELLELAAKAIGLKLKYNAGIHRAAEGRPVE